jgi:TolB-like protein
MRRSTSRTWLVALLALAVLAPISAQAPATVALSDFVINSANPSFAYLGKGFAEIVAFEIKKAPQIKLVDREQRNKLLEEMEFSLSGLSDPSTQVQIGMLLSVRFLVSGSITDMGGPLLISLSMVDVQTGEIVWNDQLTESSSKYAYIGAYFATSLLRHFNATISKDTESTLAAAREGDAASVVALSKGIAALDEGKKDEAKKQLTAARKIDPGNDVAQAFLDKLATASAKFKVVPERYVTYYNPAYLGGMTKDRTYINFYKTRITGGLEGDNHPLALDDTGLVGVWEEQSANAFGYAYPLSDTLGVSFDGTITSREESIDADDAPYGFAVVGSQEHKYYGVFIGLGYSQVPNVSIGAAVGASYISRKYYLDDGSTDNGDEWDPYDHMDYWGFGGLVAAVVRNGAGSVAWDIVAGLGITPSYVFDYGLSVFEKKSDPLYVEQTLSLAFNDKKTIVGLKQVNDLYMDRAFYYGRLMPCAEQWFFGKFSVRAGVEGTLIVRDSDTKLGWGGTGGITIRLWQFDLDINYTYRQRPSYSMEEIIVPESVTFITLTANGLLKK